MKNTVLNHFDNLAQYYGYRPPYGQEIFRKIVDSTNLDGYSNILDVCSGDGSVANGLIDYVGKVVGIEGSKEMLRVAKQHPRITYKCCDVNSLPIPDDITKDTYDLLTFGRAIHWVDAQSASELLKNCLKPSGSVAVLGSRWAPSPWLSEYKSIISKYGSNSYPADMTGQQKLVSLGFNTIEKLSTEFGCMVDIDFLINQALSRFSANKGIEAFKIEFSRDLEMRLSKYIDNHGKISAAVFNWSLIYKKVG
jgi:ubiquinone/menaquinone biosynthesis C-methylase UbiE